MDQNVEHYFFVTAHFFIFSVVVEFNFPCSYILDALCWVSKQFTSFINLSHIDRMVLSLFSSFLSLFVVRVVSICPCDEHFSNLSTGSIGAPFQPSAVRLKEPLFPHVHC